jgi:hypothetical protein
MGTLGKSDNDKMSLRFDGTPKTYPTCKEVMIKWADGEGFPWMIEGRNAICCIFQAANAKAAKGTRSSSSTGTISMDIKAYDQKEITADFEKTNILVSVALQPSVCGRIARKFSERIFQTPKSLTSLWPNLRKCMPISTRRTSGK